MYDLRLLGDSEFIGVWFLSLEVSCPVLLEEKQNILAYDVRFMRNGRCTNYDVRGAFVFG